MADGKWIPDLHPTTPLVDAARHVLTVRLDTVRHYLPLAVQKADEDTEHVHQLRVGTRRAAAALRIFGDCLPDKARKAARKQLRAVRRAAGEARDWDVFLLELDAWGPKHTDRQRPGIDFLTGYGIAQRAAAQKHLEDAIGEGPFAYDRFLTETVAAVHRPDAPHLHTLLDLARPRLAQLLQKLDEAAARDLNDYGNLHRVRIAGKRLRYAMEVFADCFAPPFKEEMYPAVEEMQEILGRANDSHVAVQRLSALAGKLKAAHPAEWKRYRAGVEGLLRYHRQRLPRERRRFQAWWRRWQASGAEGALAQLLRSPEAATA
ncbi:MAG TPA: CHAD domain-containing protein [Gemmataceae bacterium]|nr:CHAD domain-containing protein [Gemmataceae bacterium]